MPAAHRRGSKRSRYFYPAEWMAARLPRLEAEDARHQPFSGQENLLKRLQALKQADFTPCVGHRLPDADYQRR